MEEFPGGVAQIEKGRAVRILEKAAVGGNLQTVLRYCHGCCLSIYRELEYMKIDILHALWNVENWIKYTIA